MARIILYAFTKVHDLNRCSLHTSVYAIICLLIKPDLIVSYTHQGASCPRTFPLAHRELV